MVFTKHPLWARIVLATGDLYTNQMYNYRLLSPRGRGLINGSYFINSKYLLLYKETRSQKSKGLQKHLDLLSLLYLCLLPFL